MKRTVCLVFSLLLSFAGPVLAQERTGAAQEKIVRETYRKLELYNAAAQVLENERMRRAVRPENVAVKFELTDFRSGNVQEIMNKPYAELVTLPTGDVVSLTRGGHAQDGGPQEATFGAAWERGQYASVFDPGWTVADVFHFEAARYYNISTYVSYRVTVRLHGRARDYRALALFRDTPDGAPEFWDAIVNGVGSVWEEKRPPYKAKNGILVETSASLDDGGSGDVGDTIIPDDGGGDTLFSSTPLPIWISGDLEEHASGWHGGTAKFTGQCFVVPNNQQRCSVAVNEFAAFETGTLSNFTPFFWHVGSKDQKTENRTGPRGSSIRARQRPEWRFRHACSGRTAVGAQAFP